MWRIAVEAPAFSASEISGAGALRSAGRWNSAGTAVLYCSTNISLATLESLVNRSYGPLPYNRYLVRIDIPEPVWSARETCAPSPGWDAIPAGRTSRNAGDAWATGKRSPIMLVPSVIVPEEHNILINPLHPASSAITATTIRRWNYDPRL